LIDFQDLQAVGEIHDCGESLFKLLVASLSPAIYGHDLVKAGLILGLFGGNLKF
jgi:DNA helicase MCM8